MALLFACVDHDSSTGIHNPLGPENPPPASAPQGLIVSDPAPRPAASAQRTGTLSAAAARGDSFVYVSLVPGTAPGGVVATVRSLASGLTVTTAVSGGGFDPVPATAGVGDTLEVLVRGAAGAVVFTARVAVAASRPPVIVRTEPPPKKRDVPLNASIMIVFSEPIDAKSLNSQSVRLSSAGQPVTGRLVLASDGLRVEFQPDQDLAPSTQYTLSVTTDVADLTGDRLEQAVAADFTTASGAIPGMSQIAFVGWDETHGRGNIWVVNADGSGARRVMGDPSSSNLDPAWSPDGRKIAFARGWVDGENVWNIYVMNADGSGVVRLTTGRFNWAPAWSPDGMRIAYADFDSRPDSSGLGGGGIKVMNADGTGTTLVVRAGYDGLGYLDGPAWSPDGRRIAFSSAYDIYVMNADGTGVTRLDTGTHGTDGHATTGAWHCPAWSPDGTRIAYRQTTNLANNMGDAAIYVINADGSGVTRLTDPGLADCPTWSPDGTKIAFPDLRGGLYAMNADGSGLARLANIVAFVARVRPAWSPVGFTTGRGAP